MPAGYFETDTIHVELGEHVFFTPAGRRRVAVRQPHSTPARVLPSGGGVLELEVTGQRLRANLGDAERYVYEHLHALATSGPGFLGAEDNRGNRHVFADAVCVSARAEVRAYRFADIQYVFHCAESDSDPVWNYAPDPPPFYAGTSTAQNYTAGGVTLATGVGMRLGMERQWPLREVPRTRGARLTRPPSGAHLRFIVRAHAVAENQNLAEFMESLMRDIGPGELDLSANGNTYQDVVLEGVRPEHTDLHAAACEIEFLKQL